MLATGCGSSCAADRASRMMMTAFSVAFYSLMSEMVSVFKEEVQHNNMDR